MTSDLYKISLHFLEKSHKSVISAWEKRFRHGRICMSQTVGHLYGCMKSRSQKHAYRMEIGQCTHGARGSFGAFGERDRLGQSQSKRVEN